MALFTTVKLESLQQAFGHKLQCLYDVELRLVEALPKMREAATNPELKQGFGSHLTETEGQVLRLERIFQMLNEKPQRVTASVLKALVAEGDEIISAKGEPSVKDAVLIAVGRSVEHHEMALYETAVTWAQALGLSEAAELLQETLEEEESADEKLSTLAEAAIHAHGAHGH